MQQDRLPLVSVIVPIYRIERYIGLCIESLLNQDYRNIEIILVDDGSPDRCPDICDLYASKDSRIKVIHKTNGGLVSARKAGLAASTGAYISNVDGDDWVEGDFISSLMEAILISHSDAVIAGQERNFFGQTKRLLNKIPFGIYEGKKLEAFFHEMISSGAFYNLGIFTYVWNKIFKRNVYYDSQMGVDERISIGEDAACSYPALLACKKIVVTGNSSYHYRQREDSMLKKSSPFKTEAPSIKLLHDYMMEKMKWKDRMREQIQDYILSIFLIRSGGLLPQADMETEGIYPFGICLYGRRVAIYSAGTFGQQIRSRMTESGCCEIVGWFDEDYWEYRRCCLDVDPVENIRKTDFDYLLVASVNPKTAVIKEKIADMGISRDKILTLQCEMNREQMLNNYLIYAQMR